MSRAIATAQRRTCALSSAIALARRASASGNSVRRWRRMPSAPERMRWSGAQELPDQRRGAGIERLAGPGGLEHLVPVVGVLFFEGQRPFVDRGEGQLGLTGAQFAFRKQTSSSGAGSSGVQQDEVSSSSEFPRLQASGGEGLKIRAVHAVAARGSRKSTSPCWMMGLNQSAVEGAIRPGVDRRTTVRAGQHIGELLLM